MNYTTAIFDMDGVLIDSEPFWRIAEKGIFREEGVDITDDMCLDVQGMKAEHVVEKWVAMFPHLRYSVMEYTQRIQDKVAALIAERGAVMPGIPEALEFFRGRGCKILVASASCYRLINAVVDKLGIREYFDILHSSQDELRGKPFPDVFIHAAQRAGADPKDCIVIEDSGNGVRAAKAANMSVIAIPASSNYDNPVFDMADYKLRSALEIPAILCR